ncbi:MAG: hypothetical protein DMF93_18450 [Acidobacteria bacterium]|nr:MAG: hypothetical protein DMF93_18450 [Acidobacteriota bacterium]
MPRLLQAILAALLALSAIPASAQTGDGSLRGYVRDQQGGVLPGVTVTVKSPDLLAPVSAVSDTAGYYRLNNLPPGQYTLTADLAGFAAYKREGILMRAGSTFSVDIEMTLSTVQESVTVTGESPMIETSKPTSTLNIQGELLRAAPVTSRRLFSDVLDMAPGVSSRNVDDGVGRRGTSACDRGSRESAPRRCRPVAGRTISGSRARTPACACRAGCPTASSSSRASSRARGARAPCADRARGSTSADPSGSRRARGTAGT